MKELNVVRVTPYGKERKGRSVLLPSGLLLKKVWPFSDPQDRAEAPTYRLPAGVRHRKKGRLGGPQTYGGRLHRQDPRTARAGDRLPIRLLMRLEHGGETDSTDGTGRTSTTTDGPFVTVADATDDSHSQKGGRLCDQHHHDRRPSTRAPVRPNPLLAGHGRPYQRMLRKARPTPDARPPPNRRKGNPRHHDVYG